MVARLAHAGQLSLGLAALSVLSAAIPGVLLAIVAAWRGGWLERACRMANGWSPALYPGPE